MNSLSVPPPPPPPPFPQDVPLVAEPESDPPPVEKKQKVNEDDEVLPREEVICDDYDSDEGYCPDWPEQKVMDHAVWEKYYQQIQESEDVPLVAEPESDPPPVEKKQKVNEDDEVLPREEVICDDYDSAAAAMWEEEMEGKVMEGVASIALLKNGSISGHFVHLPDSVCYGLHGTEMVCERECSHGEDYRLVKLTIIDYNRKKEREVIVECKGHDAARIHNVDHAHGWENDVVNMLDKKDRKQKIHVSFECETLKAGKAAEDHINKFMPKLAGADAVVNVGKMSIIGLDFEDETGTGDDNQQDM